VVEFHPAAVSSLRVQQLAEGFLYLIGFHRHTGFRFLAL
jgi:hypothetical protein